jgi:ATP-dependent HslUV protease ATP-binding subunit HslU
MIDLDKLTPKEIVAELDKYIIGQNKAKKAVSRDCAALLF